MWRLLVAMLMAFIAALVGGMLKGRPKSQTFSSPSTIVVVVKGTSSIEPRIACDPTGKGDWCRIQGLSPHAVTDKDRTAWIITNVPAFEGALKVDVSEDTNDHSQSWMDKPPGGVGH